MIWLLLTIPVIEVLATVALINEIRLRNRDKDYVDLISEQGMFKSIAVAILATALIVGTMVPLSRQLDHHQDSMSCRQWGHNIGREVRYLDNSYWDYGCYAKSDRGNWIPRGSISETELRGG